MKKRAMSTLLTLISKVQAILNKMPGGLFSRLCQSDSKIDVEGQQSMNSMTGLRKESKWERRAGVRSDLAES